MKRAVVWKEIGGVAVMVIGAVLFYLT